MSIPSRARRFDFARRRGMVFGTAALAGGSLLSMLDAVAAQPSQVVDPLTAAELKRAAERGALCSPSNVTGSGLRGEYFAQEIGRGAPLLTRVDTTVDFDPSFEWPAELATNRPASGRWTGWVKPPISGRYRFHADQPGTRVVVAQQVMAGEGAGSGAPIELSAGRYYPITLEASRLAEVKGRLRLEWTAPYGARYVVPRALLFVPVDSAPTPNKS